MCSTSIDGDMSFPNFTVTLRRWSGSSWLRRNMWGTTFSSWSSPSCPCFVTSMRTGIVFPENNKVEPNNIFWPCGTDWPISINSSNQCVLPHLHYDIVLFNCSCSLTSPMSSIKVLWPVSISVSLVSSSSIASWPSAHSVDFPDAPPPSPWDS